MNRIDVLIGTNRSNSYTSHVAAFCHEVLNELGIESRLISIEDIPFGLIDESFYKKGPNPFREYAQSLFQSPHVLIVSPEYNGSYPGILKLLLDACEPSIFKGKRMALVGVASGRAGNLRGMDQLALVLNYLKAEVYSQKIPVSSVQQLMNEHRQLSDENTRKVLTNQLKDFIAYCQLSTVEV